MNQPGSPSSPRVAVVGGGISGLAAALRILELAPDARLRVFEAGDHWGGVVQTEERDGYLLERSADSFITNPPHLVELCRQIGFDEELIGTDPRYRSAFVVHRGGLVRIPEGFALMTANRWLPIATTRLLSWRGKARLAWEALAPARRADDDESFANFARRRLGREAYENLVQPLVSGIYTADPERLSMRAALPRFVEMESRYGSLFRAMRAEARAGRAGDSSSGARYNLFLTPRRGLGSLIEAIRARLPADSLSLRTRIEQIEKLPNGWRMRAATPAGAESSEFDAIVLATASHHAARLCEALDSDLATDLARIEYAGCVIALAGYRRTQIAHPLDGFGLVVPAKEGRKILSVSFSSVKFPGRAPADRGLLRVFLGGACQPEMQSLDDAEILRVARDELGELLGARGEPELFEIARWDRAMPQYHLGHVELVERIASRAARHPGLALAGNAYRGVGLPLCVLSGQQAAERALTLHSPSLGS